VDGGAIARQLPLRIQSRVSVVFNGIDLQTFRPGLDGQGWRAQFGISPGELVIGHAARITPWKGQWYLLEAFGKIAPRYSNVRLLLVGAPIFDSDLYERRLRARVDELGLSQRVTFAGFRADLADALSAMDIFVYPSLEKDTTPLALLSAMGCGLPVAAFDIEGAREALDDAGILVPVGDAEKLAEALEKLVGDASLRKRLAERSRARAVRHFGLEKYAAEMESVFLRGLA